MRMRIDRVLETEMRRKLMWNERKKAEREREREKDAAKEKNEG